MSLLLLTKRSEKQTEVPSLSSDDDYLLNELKTQKIEYKIVPWDQLTNYSGKNTTAIFRSTWDYHKHVDDFRSTIATAANNISLYNDLAFVEWNIDKKYLKELGKAGIKIIPMEILKQGTDSITLPDIIYKHKWHDSILKPSISVGSEDTVRIVKGNITDAMRLLDKQLHKRAFIIQPFMETIFKGEFSFIYIDGLFSHAVQKIPKSDDFRSQSEFGSTVQSIKPTEVQLNACEKIMNYIKNKFNKTPLYARIDLITDEMLMELELIEPCLYFQWCPPAAQTLVEAMKNRILN